MVGNVKSNVWWCVSVLSTSTRLALVAYRSAECLRRRNIECVNHQEQIGRVEQAPALRCSEGAVLLEPCAEGRECDGGYGMFQGKGRGRGHRGGHALEVRQDTLDRLVARAIGLAYSTDPTP